MRHLLRLRVEVGARNSSLLTSMKICISLLRGINVGGKHALFMKDLIAMLEELGAREVKTYIQSGNAVFVWGGKDISRLVDDLRAEIKKRRGFDPHILLLDFKNLESVIQQNPFPEAGSDSTALHAGFLAAVPESPDLKALESLKSDSEEFRLVDRVFYLYAPEGVGRSKLAAGAERLLGVPMTDRNWRTVSTLWKIAQELNQR
jgi:uncharacterized protein (DUF1697 family)